MFAQDGFGLWARQFGFAPHPVGDLGQPGADQVIVDPGQADRQRRFAVALQQPVYEAPEQRAPVVRSDLSMAYRSLTILVM
ncbi:MAG: hypothetical protein BroJett038_31310 [Chloroflexota bacterium]|nr:MAG: hypothetical protein BroJett038_31310 [Chloroflexota bacterium]